MPALDLQQIISQALSFLLLLWILRRFAWRPLLAVLDERRARIEQEFRDIARHKEELSRLKEDYGQRLAKIEDEARAKVQQAVLDGKRIAMEIQEQARAQGQSLIAKSTETVELELAKAKVTLRDQVATMTVDAIERILHEKLDEQADRRLVDEVLEDLERKQSKP
jgi:F-type H+-transporting ATPase subunit b